ncbi:hypothetical protein BGZ49_000872 [Haplosporangium sp. Z 27]|nr:hypothetical protein BGZ49_000872 [Haplosporangium sp. Z 27]
MEKVMKVLNFLFEVLFSVEFKQNADYKLSTFPSANSLLPPFVFNFINTFTISTTYPFPANEATLCNTHPPAPEYTSTPSIDTSAPIALSDNHRDANSIENTQIVGASYVDAAAIFNRRYEDVVNKMSKLGVHMSDNSDNPSFSYNQYSNLYKTLAAQEKVLREEIQRFYPTRNPHIDQLVTLIETQWHILPQLLRPVLSGQLMFSRYNYCPPKAFIGKYTTSIPDPHSTRCS